MCCPALSWSDDGFLLADVNTPNAFVKRWVLLNLLALLEIIMCNIIWPPFSDGSTGCELSLGTRRHKTSKMLIWSNEPTVPPTGPTVRASWTLLKKSPNNSDFPFTSHPREIRQRPQQFAELSLRWHQCCPGQSLSIVEFSAAQLEQSVHLPSVSLACQQFQLGYA